VELRGLEPLTPTLPGAGRRRDQARWDANGCVAGVAGTATVVTVVVKTVVGSLSDTAALLRLPHTQRSCADDRMRQGWRSHHAVTSEPPGRSPALCGAMPGSRPPRSLTTRARATIRREHCAIEATHCGPVHGPSWCADPAGVARALDAATDLIEELLSGSTPRPLSPGWTAAIEGGLPRRQGRRAAVGCHDENTAGAPFTLTLRMP